MLPFLYLVILCWNFLFIKSEDNANLTITLKPVDNCTTDSSYTFTEGQNVTLVVKPSMHINHGWWHLSTQTGVRQLYDELKTIKPDQNGTYPDILYSRIVDATMAGLWEFKFYYYRNNLDFQKMSKLPMAQYKDNANYTKSLCNTTVTIGGTIKVIVIASAVAAVLLVVIIAEAAYIFLLKAKARELIKLNTHNNLSKKSDSIPDDRARYCTNPGQKTMKEPIPVEADYRDSVIYETPNIEISNNTRLAMQPPQPPAITTIPRTPRSDHSLKSNPKGILASALNSPARSPISDTLPPNFQRPKNFERESSVANRPPLPLPSEDYRHNPMIQEVYEEMGNENTYQPPPVINTMPPRLPMPPKKVPTGNLLDVKENTLKSRQGQKPAVTPKPQTQRPHAMTPANEFEQALRRRNNDAMTPANEFEQALRRRNNESTIPRGNPVNMMQPQHQEQTHRRRPMDDVPTNELQEAMKRRNNVMQVPIVSIPDPSTRSSPKPRPPPVQKSKPPPTRHPVQEEIYYNEASSDEEWTYEPLKPLNSYDSNIYNI